LTGMRRYSFQIDGQMNPMEHLKTTYGRHDLIWELPGIWTTRRVYPEADIGPHHRSRYATEDVRSGGAQGTTAGLRHLLRVPGASTRLSQIGIRPKAAVDQVQAQAIAVVASRKHQLDSGSARRRMRSQPPDVDNGVTLGSPSPVVLCVGGRTLTRMRAVVSVETSSETARRSAPQAICVTH
jgi:hypothetical protein